MLNNLFRRPLFGVRFAQGTFVDGRWVEGVTSIISLEASVQPTTPHDLLTLDIARRERKSYTLYTDFKLLCLTSGIKNPDCVDINGERYEVSAEAPWRNDVISHYKYIVTLKQAIEDAEIPIPPPAFDFTWTCDALGISPASIDLLVQRHDGGIQFALVSVDEVNSVIWDFGDGHTDTKIIPTKHTYATAGDYDVSIQVNGDPTLTKTHALTITPPPPVDFKWLCDALEESAASINIDVQISDSGVQFELLSTTGINSAIWDFGDGNTDTNIVPAKHIYALPGAYTVTVQANDMTELTKTHSLTITPTPIIVDFGWTCDALGTSPASIDLDIQTGDGGVKFTLTNTTGVVSALWNFGDSNTDVNIAPEKHLYAEAGDYEISVQVNNDPELIKTHSLTIAPSIPPDVDFKWTCDALEESAPSIDLDAQANDGGIQFEFKNIARITSAIWDFGDGHTDTNIKPAKHIYAEVDDYEVSVQVNGDPMLTESHDLSITSTPIPVVPNFVWTCDDLIESAPLIDELLQYEDESPIQFVDTSTGVVTSWLWDFGDGNTDTKQIPDPHSFHHHFGDGYGEMIEYDWGWIITYTITLMLNGNPELTKSHQIGIIHYTPA